MWVEAVKRSLFSNFLKIVLTPCDGNQVVMFLKAKASTQADIMRLQEESRDQF